VATIDDPRSETFMAVLPIITAPHPVLEDKAREVRPDEFGEGLAKHLSDMAETMYAAPGVGLAAPQVSDSRRLVVIDSEAGEGSGERLRKFANPTIVERSKESIFWRETCLSVPELEVEVQRAQRILVRWSDPLNGETKEERFEGYEAVIVQHELDHLDGTILLSRTSRFKRSRYIKRVKKLRQQTRVEIS